MDIAAEISQLYRDYGTYDYIGEKVTQTQHMIQAAMIAEQEGCDDETVIAIFLHDVGHLIGFKEGQKQMDGYGTVDHDKLGGAYLRSKGFSEKICRLVENHVNAKRYLVSVDPTYYDELSDASKKTLEYQGGRMSDEEMYEFDNDEYKELYIKFRRIEEQSKEVDKEIEPIEKYLKMIIKHINK